mgnify:CR=1 FL=1
MKLNIPDRHLTISNVLMILTLFAVAGGGIGVLFQQVLMLVITVAVLAAFALTIYAIWQVIAHSGGVVVHYDEPTYTEPQRVEHVHHHYHRIVGQPEQSRQQRMIEQRPVNYTVLPPQHVQLSQQHNRLEVKQ